MSVILAVDIVNGKAVKAYAGIRTNYKPLNIKEKDFSNPIKLIQSFQEKMNLKKIYIADLDAIKKNGNNIYRGSMDVGYNEISSTRN